MKLLRTDLAAAGALAVSIAASWLSFDKLPAQVATHFDLHGTPNGWMSKATVMWFLPVVTVAVWALVRFAHLFWRERMGLSGLRVMPLAAAITVAFLAAVHVLILRAALTPHTNVARMTAIIMGLFFAALGVILPRVQQNAFVGIRTPWTLASKEVWARTHRMAGYCMVSSGALAALLALASETLTPVALAAAVLGSLAPAVYSAVISVRKPGT
jgi:uncharacterized membrane protein